MLSSPGYSGTLPLIAVFCPSDAAQGIVQNNFILVAERFKGIYQVDLETESVHLIHTPDISPLNLAAIAYDEHTGRVYWSEWDTEYTINSVLLDGTDVQLLVTDSKGMSYRDMVIFRVRVLLLTKHSPH
jgi:hypothetical protein